jgi:hypothetical protein
MAKWTYKFVISERLETGLWNAVEEDEKKIEPKPINEYLNLLGQNGWELVAVVPFGATDPAHAEQLKHILKKEKEA